MYISATNFIPEMMYNRRKFLQNAGSLVIGQALLSNKLLANSLNPAGQPIGLQLYTLSSIIDDDLDGTLKKVAAIGYKEIESAYSKKGGFYGMKAPQFAAHLKSMGLSWKSHHVIGAPITELMKGRQLKDANGKPMVFPALPNLKENMQQVVDEAAAGGLPYLVCASIPVDTAADLKVSVKTLNKTAEACHKAGITFAYHNHDKEFEKVDGLIPYDILLKETDPNKLKMELDLCWVTKAGVDPVMLFKQNPGRFPLLHVKDIDQGKEKPLPVGTGVVDFKHVFANAKIGGVKHYFVEHDMPADPFASITTSYQNLKKLLAATV